ncbi:MAG: flagellar basal body P-ring formation chaperone FlgA [Paracoccaceae bacterium]
MWFRGVCVVLLLTPVWAEAEQVFASRTLRAGTLLSAADMRAAKDGEASRLANDMVGLEVRRAIYVGRVISEHDLGPPTLIRRNDVVTMVYRTGTLGLRTQGRSLGSGGLGEVVEILNLDTRLKVRATVTGQNEVQVFR